MTWDFERVAGPFGFTEGPVWNGDRVLFTDIPSSRILAYDPSTGETTEFRRETRGATGLDIDSEGRLFACELEGRQVSMITADGTEPIAQSYDGTSLNSPNDLAVEYPGRIWFTDPFFEIPWLSGWNRSLPHESVYRVDRREADWTVSRVTDDTTKPNGIRVSPDGSTVYVAESNIEPGGDRELRAYSVNVDGSLGTYEILHNFAPHRGIDGMCLDAEGNIIAAAGSDESGPGPMLYVFTANGSVLATHPFPGDLPTNCTLGGHSENCLYVTGDGWLYKARTERRRIPERTVP